MKKIMMTALLALSTSVNACPVDDYDQIDFSGEVVTSGFTETVINAGTAAASTVLGELVDQLVGVDGAGNVVRGFGQALGYNSTTDMLVRKGLRGEDAPTPKSITLGQVAQGLTTAASAFIPGVGAAKYLEEASRAKDTVSALAATNKAVVSYLPGGGLLVKSAGWFARGFFGKASMTHVVCDAVSKTAGSFEVNPNLSGAFDDYED